MTPTHPTGEMPPAFTFVDLFAGIGGFAAALTGLGGTCVYAIENDPAAARVYEANHGHNPLGDITHDANGTTMLVPDHDVLAAGFPCQPFSKSGKQRGMSEARGTLFWNIMRVIEERQPSLVILENVRNLAGPRHRHEWDVIIASLRGAGYIVSGEPAVFSPHKLANHRGGSPQHRERVFIAATYAPHLASRGYSPEPLHLGDDYGAVTWPEVASTPLGSGTRISEAEGAWLDAWADFVDLMRRLAPETTIPSFPLWCDTWGGDAPAADTPAWKSAIITKNQDIYARHRDALDSWMRDHRVRSFPPSRRKLEWQAGRASSLWDCIIQLRPSGVRVKTPTHFPALVAITQTPIVGPRRRRLGVQDSAALQGLPAGFSFAGQSDAQSFKQLGNSVHVGLAREVTVAHAARDLWALPKDRQRVAHTILSASGVPHTAAPIPPPSTSHVHYSPVRVTASRRYAAMSPLRYPGGKASLAGYLADIIRELELSRPIFVEPYAGGAGAGITLLQQGVIDSLVINDIDPSVHAFWHAATRHNDHLAELASTAALDMDMWREQRAIYDCGDTSDPIRLGFAFFYLNRTNRSGILGAGPIGGKHQNGNYTLDARFNRQALVARLRAIGELSARISVTHRDGCETISQYACDRNAVMFVDPPYVAAGPRLYSSAFTDSDHQRLARTLCNARRAHWLATYDADPTIGALYRDRPVFQLDIHHSTSNKGRREELLIASDSAAAAAGRLARPERPPVQGIS